MSANIDTYNGNRFRPAFCQRGSDCGAQADKAFCATCGADIAAYLAATTANHPAVAEAEPGQVTQVLPVTHLTSAQAVATPVFDTVTSPAVGPVAETALAINDTETATRSAWREPAVVAMFALATALGAVGAVLADLV